MSFRSPPVQICNNLKTSVARTKGFPALHSICESDDLKLRELAFETVAFLVRLPEDFLARKGSYWRLAYNMVDEPYHFNTHLDQMRSAIEAAREHG